MIENRDATINDIKEIKKIYNEAVLKTNATFDINKKTDEDMKKWFKGHKTKNPIIVSVKERRIIAFASLSKYDDKKAYENTSELSLYVLKGHQGKGIGKKLMKDILKKGKEVGIHAVIARITKGNKISIHLHESFGFEKIGTLKEVGKKFGKVLDVHIFEKVLS